MGIELGVFLALAAMLLWGFGDFLIQKSARKFGDWETLFMIELIGTIILTPFVIKDIRHIFSFQDNSFWILLSASIILLFAALLNFEALKKGKLAVIEPFYALEIPAASLLAFIIIKESLAFYQVVLIITLTAGLFLLSLRSHHLSKKAWIEKGVVIAVIAAVLMGASTFFFGLSSRVTNPLITNWFTSLFLFLACFSYLGIKRRIPKFIRDIKSEKKLVISMGLFDNLAWVAFAFAAVLAPISIAVAISESFIIITVFLGIYVNKEVINKHQLIGLILSIIATIILAVTTN